MLRMGKRKKQRDCHGLYAGAPDLRDERLEVHFFQWFEYFTRRGDTLANAKAKFVIDDRRRTNGIEVVEFRTRLASNRKDVFEPFRGDESGASAASLQQRVSAHRRAVN